MTPKETTALIGLVMLLALGASSLLVTAAKTEHNVAIAQATRDCEKLLSLSRTPADTLSIVRSNQFCLQLVP